VWWAAVGRDAWPDGDAESRGYVEEVWQKPFGDRRQEIVLIGRSMDREALTRMLDGALLTDAEMILGQQGWDAFPDPLSGWEITQDPAVEPAGAQVPAPIHA
jgi:hypothetical protein